MLEAATTTRQIVTRPQEVWSEEEIRARWAAADRARHAFLAAELDSGVVGVLGLTRGEREANAHTAEFGLTVAQAQRGRGVGTALIRAAEERARSWGVRKVCLGVFADNLLARRLYERLGYAEEGVRKGHYVLGGSSHDEVLMAKWI